MDGADMRGRMKQTLSRRIFFMSLAILGIGILVGSGYLFGDLVRTEQTPAYVIEFQSGFFTGLGVLLVIQIIRCQRSLNNEKALQKLYYELTDERTRYIHQQTGGTVMFLAAVGVMLASMVAVYLNSLVSLTLLICSLCLFGVQAGVKLVLKLRLRGQSAAA